MSRLLCGNCGHAHDSSWTRAVGRFDESTPTVYEANYPQSVRRLNRAEAEADMCGYLKEAP